MISDACCVWHLVCAHGAVRVTAWQSYDCYCNLWNWNIRTKGIKSWVMFIALFHKLGVYPLFGEVFSSFNSMNDHCYKGTLNFLVFPGHYFDKLVSVLILWLHYTHSFSSALSTAMLKAWPAQGSWNIVRSPVEGVVEKTWRGPLMINQVHAL